LTKLNEIMKKDFHMSL